MNLPNLISVERLLCGLLTAVFAGLGRPGLALTMFLIGQVTDPLDGAIARRQGTASPEGGTGDWFDLAGDTALTWGGIVGLVLIGAVGVGIDSAVVGIHPAIVESVVLIAIVLALTAVGQLIYMKTKFPIVFIGSVVLYVPLTYGYIEVGSPFHPDWATLGWVGAFTVYVILIGWSRMTQVFPALHRFDD